MTSLEIEGKKISVFGSENAGSPLVILMEILKQKRKIRYYVPYRTTQNISINCINQRTSRLLLN